MSLKAYYLAKHSKRIQTSKNRLFNEIYSIHCCFICSETNEKLNFPFVLRDPQTTVQEPYSRTVRSENEVYKVPRLFKVQL